MARHAEIAGAGFSGLVAAVALLQRGWTVRVHERTPLLRSEGFGISIHENGRRVFAALGGEIATDSAVASAVPEGALVLEDGRRFKADLIIGADGYNSRVRESVD